MCNEEADWGKDLAQLAVENLVEALALGICGNPKGAMFSETPESFWSPRSANFLLEVKCLRLAEAATFTYVS